VAARSTSRSGTGARSCVDRKHARGTPRVETWGALAARRSKALRSAMKITSIETGLYRVPLAEPLVDSTIRLTEWELVISRIRTDNGVAGTGWSYTLGTGGRAIRALIEDTLAPFVLGQDPFHTERLNERLWWAISRMGTGP